LNLVFNAGRNITLNGEVNVAGTIGLTSGVITDSYSNTSGFYTWTVPSGNNTITVTADGAKGGQGASHRASGGIGGDGASVTATILVPVGKTLYISNGGQGGNASSGSGGVGGVGAFAPGGFGGSSNNGRGAGGGGGATVISTSISLSNALIVAAGGGGGGGAAVYLLSSGSSGSSGGNLIGTMISGTGGNGSYNTSSIFNFPNSPAFRGGGGTGGGGGGYIGGAGGSGSSSSSSGGAGGAGGVNFIIPGSTSITQGYNSSNQGRTTITYSGSTGNILIQNLKATGGLTFNTQGSYTNNSQTTPSPLRSNFQAEQRNIEKSTSSFTTSSTNSPITKTTMTPSQMFNSFKPQAGSRFIKSTETNKTLPKDAKSNKTETNNQQNQKKDSSTDTKSNNIINQNEPNKTQSNNQPNQKQSSSSAVNDDEGL
jgi:hypothetical protein